MCVVCVLMSGIKEKRHLEDIRKLHRKLREAKEDPTHAGLAGLSSRDAADSGYGESELGAGAGAGAAAAMGAGVDGLDQEVHLQMDDEPLGAAAAAGAAAGGAGSSYAAGKKASSARAATARKAPKPRYEPEESVEDEGYDEQPAGATGYDDEDNSAQAAAGGGYAQHDEYDEEEN